MKVYCIYDHARAEDFETDVLWHTGWDNVKVAIMDYENQQRELNRGVSALAWTRKPTP